MFFADRFEAGRVLAQRLAQYRDQPGVIVLALPRGGVPVAYQVAQSLHAPLDVFLVRKLGLPGHEELAMGALAMDDEPILNQEVVDHFGIGREIIEEAARAERQTLEAQARLFRPGKPPLQLTGKTVILIDDGLATGSTMRAAVQAIRRQRPARIVVAVPVGAAETCAEMQDEVDEAVCAVVPPDFTGVGMYYHDFRPTPDELVQDLLHQAGQAATAPGKSA
jgi:putative phosphoribosyl transferase